MPHRRFAGNFLATVLFALLAVSAVSAATCPAGATTLTPGQTVSGTVGFRVYVYYCISIGDAETLPLTISVTPSGVVDPDLFVSIKNSQPQSGAADTFAGSFYGGDSYTFQPAEFGTGAARMAYASVSCFDAPSCTFSIVASFNNVYDLVEGQAQSLTVTRGALVSFKFPDTGGSATTRVTFALTVLRGTVSLFVGNAQMPVPSDASTFQWQQLSYQGGAPLVVEKGATWPGDNIFRIVVRGPSVRTSM